VLGYKVTINKNKPIYVGVKNGVVSIILSYTAGIRNKEGEDLFAHIGGLNTELNQHFRWVKHRKVKKSDKFIIEAVEFEKPTRITSKYPEDVSENIKQRISRLKRTAKELGYEIRKVKKLPKHVAK
jgi:hypothetical protein